MNTRRPDSAAPLTQARRIVVKVGSALLVDGDTGRVNRAWLETLVEDLLRLRKRGQPVILVSAGAIVLGRRRLGLKHGALRLEESQAAAAVGQIRLAHAYKELLEGCDVTVAQVLLTLEDSERRRRYLNARATLESLLALGALPVINENDTVATAEIRYGDNDRLAARVAQMAGADCLVLLSDVEGLYSADPTRDPGARFIHEVPQITPGIEAMAGRAAAQVGSGGMAAKMAAARIAVAAGCHMCIAAGVHRHPLRRIEEGADCTWFVPSATPAAASKQWIAGTLRPAGALTIDAGARRALLEGRSLLPAGVIAARGRFDRGDTVSVLAADGAEIARGIVAYSDVDAARIMGRKSSEIADILGFRGRDEMIHRDDLVLMRQELTGAVWRGPARTGSTTGAGARPSGLGRTRVAVPLAVAGTARERATTVPADAGALCLKSGNAGLLRGGSESQHSSRALHECLAPGLQSAGLPAQCIQLVPLTDRAAVGYMLAGMSEYLDVIVPRGGKTLVQRVQKEARGPVIGHLEGNCHEYIDRRPDRRLAATIPTD